MAKKKKRRSSKNDSLFDYDIGPGLDLGGSSGKSRPLTRQEKHWQGLAVLLVIIVIGVYYLWQWMISNVWQSVLIIISLIAGFVLLIWKVPSFRHYMGGEFWTKLFDFIKPPSESKRDKRLLEGKYRTPIPSGVKRKVKDRAGDKCQVCGRWGRDIHHINGNPGDHKLSNLIFLCPTCHDEANRGRPSRNRLRDLAKRQAGYKTTHN